MNEMDKIKVLADIVEIPSVNDDEVSVAKYIRDLFAKYGIESKILKVKGNRANLVAEIGEKGPILGFSGHLDVVAAKESDGWHSDPFKLVERDGKLYGRGTSDMKSGVAAMIVSLIELQQKGLKNGRIRLMLTMGEEIGEEGSAYFYEHGYMKDVSALVISEPTYYRIIYAEKGSLDLKITSRGKAAHSSMPNGRDSQSSLPWSGSLFRGRFPYTGPERWAAVSCSENRKASGGRELSASGLSDAPAYVRLSQFRQDKGSEILHGLRCKWCTWSSVFGWFRFHGLSLYSDGGLEFIDRPVVLNFRSVYRCGGQFRIVHGIEIHHLVRGQAVVRIGQLYFRRAFPDFENSLQSFNF